MTLNFPGNQKVFFYWKEVVISKNELLLKSKLQEINRFDFILVQIKPKVVKMFYI